MNEPSGGPDPKVMAAVSASIFISYSHVDKELAGSG
jgi:hypothetical protein